MSAYEFSLLQEVLMEKGATVLGDLFRFRNDNNICDRKDPTAAMYSVVWNAKRDILSAKSEEDLRRIDTKFDMANAILSEMGVIQ